MSARGYALHSVCLQLSFLSVLYHFFVIFIAICFQTEMDGEGNPLDKLTKQAVDWCRSVDVSAQTVAEIRDCPNFNKAVQAGIDRANNQAVSRAQKIQKWSVLPRDFSIPGGELGKSVRAGLN